MTPETIITLFHDSVPIIVILLSVLMLPGLAIGLIVAMFQAATQINEMSLSFIPKLLMTLMILVFAGPWLLKTMVNYTESLFANIPYLIG